MSSLALKVGVALTATGLTCAVLFAVYETRPQKVIDFDLGRSSTAADSNWKPEWQSAPGLAAIDGSSVLDAEHPVFPPSAFVRIPVRKQPFGGVAALMVPDPYVHYRYESNALDRRVWEEHPDGYWMLRTNSLGLREDDEPLEGPVDLRILIAGDSHTDGVCNNDEAFGNLLEARLRGEYPGLRIDSLNAGRGGYDFYHYLGTLERFLNLRPDVFVVGVYGGNDFDGVLTLFHQYNDSQRPPGKELYADKIKAAVEREELKPALAQSFVSYKYFDVHPDQMEVALQAARDITTEILVTCLRYSVHPIIVYIPPMPDVEWSEHAVVFETLAGLLEVSPEGLKSTDRMADSYIAFLRDRRVDVIDMRPVFTRAGPENYWLRDQHINLRAQQLIADELYPLVVAARPPEAERTRRAPISAGSPGSLLSPGSAVAPRSEAGTAPDTLAILDQPSFDEHSAARIFGKRAGTVPDPLAGYRYASNLEVTSAKLGFAERFPFVTNAQGLREDQDLAPAADLRVVITGGAQVAGACPNPQTFGNVVEAELQRRHPGRPIEVLNAGVRGYSFHNYLGVLKRSLELDPSVFVLTVSSGTDFLEVLRVDRLLSDRKFGRRMEDYADQLEAARAISPAAVEEAFDSIKYFRAHLPQGQRAYQTALELTRVMRDLAEEHGIELVVVHLPAATDVEWARHAAVFEPVREALGVERQHLDTNERVADAYLRELERLGLTVIRMGRDFAQADQPLYGPRGFLINPAAHELVAAQLVERIDDSNLPRD